MLEVCHTSGLTLGSYRDGRLSLAAHMYDHLVDIFEYLQVYMALHSMYM